MKKTIEKFGKQRYFPVNIKIIPGKEEKEVIFPKKWGKDHTPYISSLEELNTTYSVRQNSLAMILDNYLVIDIDNKKGKKGSELFGKWIKEFKLDIKEWYCEGTVNGGEHYYIKLSKPFAVDKYRYTDSGIELLSGPGCVVFMAGSEGYFVSNDGVVPEIGDLPDNFTNKILSTKTKANKRNQVVKEPLANYEEVVKRLEFIKEKDPSFWDSEGDAWKVVAFIAESFHDETSAALVDRFFDQEEWSKRTGIPNKHTNDQYIEMNTRRTKGKGRFDFESLRRIAINHFDYPDEETDLSGMTFLSALKKTEEAPNIYAHILKLKKDPLDIPHGLAGDIVRDLINNKGLNKEAAITFGSQTFPAYFFAEVAYYGRRNISQRVLQLGDSNSGKSYNKGVLDEAIRQFYEFGNTYKGFINNMPVSDGALLDDLNAEPTLNISSDEAKNFFTCKTEYSPLQSFLEVATLGKGSYLMGKSRRTSSDTPPVYEPIVNLIMNDTFVNFDEYRGNSFFGGGGVRRFDLIYIKAPHMTREVYKARRRYGEAIPLSDQVVNRFKVILDRFKKGSKKNDKTNRDYVDVVTPDHLEDFLIDIQLAFDNHKYRQPSNEHLFSYYKDRVEIFAARIALLNLHPVNGRLELSKRDLDWAGRTCLHFCLRCVELYENNNDAISKALKRAKEKIPNKNVGFTSFTRQFVQNKPQLLSLFQQVIKEDSYFQITPGRVGYSIKKRPPVKSV
jgi:hypothetical protein